MPEFSPILTAAREILAAAKKPLHMTTDKSEIPEWKGLGFVVDHMIRMSITGRVPVWFIVISTGIGLVIYYDPEHPGRMLAAPVMAILIAFVLVIMAVATVLGDWIADMTVHKMLRAPDPRNALHQALYFVLSVLGLMPSILFMDIGWLPGY